MARITSEMMPTMCAGLPNVLKGKRKPVTLVRMVVVRNTTFDTPSVRLRKKRSSTIKPEAMPTRLINTCRNVKVANGMPRTMIATLLGSPERRHDVFAEPPHRGEVLFVAHGAKAGLAKQVAHANLGQLGNLLADPGGRAIERAGRQHVGDRLAVAYFGIGPRVECFRAGLEVGRIVGF